MANDDYREQREQAREHGLAARHETRVERATLRAEWLDAVEQAMRGHDCPEVVNKNIPYLARVAVDVATPHIRKQIAEEIMKAIQEHAAASEGREFRLGLGMARRIAREIGTPRRRHDHS